MHDLSNKKLVLIGTLSLLLTLFLFVPMVQGLYGATIGAASTIGPGSYDDTMLAGDDNGYYNVTNEIGATITASLTYNDSENDFALYILRPNGSVAMSDETPDGDHTVSAVVSISAKYTIHVYKHNSVDTNLTITITITPPGSGIPGFDLLLTSFGILTLFGILILHKHRKFPL